MTHAKRTFYKPELDVLRFIAFLLVFTHHLLPHEPATQSGMLAILRSVGEVGVQIFFLLSAYLITALLLQERERTGQVQIGAFYVRRVLRIWPLYFTLILGAALLTALKIRAGFPPSALAYFSLLSGNWYVVRHGWVFSAVGVLWTVSIEEQFYLFWPATLRFFGKTGLVLLTAALIVLSYGTLVLLGIRGTPEYALRANSLVQFQFFAVGAALAMLLHGRTFRPGLRGRLLCLTGALITIWLAVAHFGMMRVDNLPPGPLLGGFFMLAMAATLTFFLLLDAALPSWAGPFVYLGRISYGLYAFHLIALPIAVMLLRYALPSAGGASYAILRLVLTFALTVGLAAVSYRFLEMPFLRLKRRFTVVPSRDETVLTAAEPERIWSSTVQAVTAPEMPRPAH